ncbi:hypothetical protein ACN9MH_16100 [Paenibacillus silvae]|uniref:hypothetical protein n=1 Tax=Paenibacillus silvae TaxID=1325358 RepID=UPI003CF67F09
MGKSNNQLTEHNLSNIKRMYYEKIAHYESNLENRSLEPNNQELFTKNKFFLNKKKYRKRKIIYIPAAAALSLCVVTGAAAAVGMIDLNSALHFLGADRIGILQPVHQVSEDQGIRMEIIGAVRDGDTTEIYVSLSDMTNYRIDETLDVYDYRITGGNASNAELIHYDKASRTAIVRFITQGKASKDRITIRINTLMSGASRKDGYDVPIEWNSLLQPKNKVGYEPLNPDRISGLGGEIANQMDNNSFQVLQQDKTNILIPGVQWMHISNIGFVNGKLHVQINPDHEIGGYNHGFFYFTDEQGHKLDIPEYSISYGHYMKDGVRYGGDYTEYVYDLSSVKAVNKIKLQGSFTNISEVIEGKWETSFKLSQHSAIKSGHVRLNMNVNGGTPAKITLSPIGVTLSGEDLSELRKKDLNIELHLKDGTKRTAESGFIQLDDHLIKWISSETIPVEEVSYILMDGKKVSLGE